MNITPQRLTQLLTSDPAWIAEFIVLNNANGVADRLGDVIGNRPLGLEQINVGLQVLLDNGRTNDFVHVLSVPLNLSAYTADEITAIYRAVAIGTDADGLSRALALQALRLWSEEPAVVVNKVVERTTTEKAAPSAPMDPAKKKSLIRAVLIGVGIIALVITTAYAIRVLRN